MIASSHNSVGAILAVSAIYINNGAEIIGSQTITILAAMSAVGVISHYLTDAIPHGHYKMPKTVLKTPKKEIQLTTFLIGAADMLASLGLFIYLFMHLFGSGSLLFLLIAICATQLPDLLMILNDSGLASNNKLIKFEQSFHAGPVHWHDLKGDKPRPWSWLDTWQLLITVLAVAICFKYSAHII